MRLRSRDRDKGSSKASVKEAMTSTARINRWKRDSIVAIVYRVKECVDRVGRGEFGRVVTDIIQDPDPALGGIMTMVMGGILTTQATSS